MKSQNMLQMKTINFVVVVFLIAFLPVRSSAQSVKFNSNAITLGELFQEVEKQTSIRFVFSEDDIDPKTTVTLNRSEYQLQSLLTELSQKRAIEFKRIDDYYVVTSNLKPETGKKVIYQRIRGKVMDLQTGTTLPSANIYQMDMLQNRTITDRDGNFEMQVPIGRLTLAVSFIGYKSKVIPLLVNTGEEQYLEVQLEESVSQLNEVTIEAERDKARTQNELVYASGRSFNVLEANKYAGTLGDPARMARSYAGVVPARDDRNDIVIRGNSPIGIQWKLDNIEIPNPNHYGGIGLTGNTTTLLNMNLLGNSDFLMGAFPSEYGNALAGVFDLHTKKINPTKRQHRFQTGWNGFEIGSDGPFSKKKNLGTYSLTYRYSFLDIMKSFGVDFGILPEFQDVTGKFDFRLSNKTTLSFLGIWGTSFIELDDREYDGADTAGPGQFLITGSDLAMGGINLEHRFNKKWLLKSNISVLENRVKTEIDTFNFNSDSQNRIYNDNSGETKYSAFLQLDYRYKRNLIRTGFRWDTYTIDYNSTSIDDFGVLETVHRQNRNMSLARFYVEDEYRFSDRFRVRAGLHSQYLLMNKSFALEPRFALRYFVSGFQIISLSYGNHHMLQPRNVYFIETQTVNGTELTNQDLDFSAAHHITLSYDFTLTENLRFKAEAYYQYLYDIPVERNVSSFSMLNTGADFFIPQLDSLVNDGLGRNYGVELTLERFLDNGYYFMLNSAFFKSEYQTKENQWRSTAFDLRYTINGLVGYEKWLGQKVAVGADVKVTYAGGKPYVPVNEVASIASSEVVFEELEAYEPRFAGYFRTDLKIYYRVNYKKLYTEFAVDLQNITNQQNVYQREFNPRNGEYNTFYHMTFFPMFTFKCLF